MLRLFLLLLQVYFSSDLLTGWFLVIFNLVNEVRAVILCQTRGLSSSVALLMGPLPGAWENWNSDILLLINPCSSHCSRRPLGWQFQGGLCV